MSVTASGRRPSLVNIVIGVGAATWLLSWEASRIPVRRAVGRRRRTINGGSRMPEVLHFTQLVRVVRDGLTRFDPDVEGNRWCALRPNLDPVRARRETQMLKRAVEVVHDAGVVSVRVDLRIARRTLDAHGTIGGDG